MTPPSYTMLNFEVDHDEKGIVRGPGPQIAWFEDPSGNTVAVMQQ